MIKHIVLLGDSIFDNAAYVDRGRAVIDHVQALLPRDWQATLAAVDGSIVANVLSQSQGIPVSATHLVVSVGGNDGLSKIGILEKPVTSVAAALDQLAALRAEFERNYRKMLDGLLALHKPLAVCTVYDPCFRDEQQQRLAKTALTIFNDCILREAIAHGLPVIDLRLICSLPEYYANEIEPGIPGGQKIAAAILKVVQNHNFSARQTVIYT